MLAKIGTGEIIVILLIAFLIVGPDKLPKLAKSFGEAVKNFKHYMTDMTKEIAGSDVDLKSVGTELANAKKEIHDTLNDTKKAVTDALTLTPPPAKAEQDKNDSNKETPAATQQAIEAPQTQTETIPNQPVETFSQQSEKTNNTNDANILAPSPELQQSAPAPIPHGFENVTVAGEENHF